MNRRRAWSIVGGLCRLVIVAGAIAVFVWYCVRQASAQVVFTAEGASRSSFYNGRCIWGTNRDEDNLYGVWALDAPLYTSIYTPQVGYVLRMDNATQTRVIAAECTWFSVPPGASCPWDDEPGSVWMTANLADTFDPATMTWWRASAGGEPEHARGADAPRLIGGEWVIPLTLRVDQSDRWWHWLGRPEQWYLHPEWFAQLPVWLEQAATNSATLRVALSADAADFSLDIHSQPPPHADLDRDGAAGVPDVFVFLAEWFAGSVVGDWDADRQCAVADIFAFLSDWFAGT